MYIYAYIYIYINWKQTSLYYIIRIIRIYHIYISYIYAYVHIYCNILHLFHNL